MSKIIGIVANWNQEEGRFWLNDNYVKYFRRYGFPILIDPMQDEVDKEIDLLVLPGGADINPMSYGQFYRPEIGMPNRPYEYFDNVVLPKYLDDKIPVFGICRGFQALNVLFGGTLHYDVPWHQTSSWDGEPVHYVSSDEENFFPVSSNHHQTLDKIGEGLNPVLYGYRMEKKKDKQKKEVTYEVGLQTNVESIEGHWHNGTKVAGCAWHPEKNGFSDSGEPTCIEAEIFVHNTITSLFENQNQEVIDF